MSELIGIREAARRLGVSDTAVHKAIKAGRVTVAGRTDTPAARPLVEWPKVEQDWNRNSDAMKRTHVGGSGKSERRKEYAGNGPAVAPRATRAEVLGEVSSSGMGGDDGGGPVAPGVSGPSLAQSRAIREAYLARQAKLDYEKSVGKVIDADQVKVQAFKSARSAREALLTLPDRLAPILASCTDVQEVHRLLLEDIERTCKKIAEEAAKAA